MWDKKDLKALSDRNAKLREEAGERVAHACLAYARVFGKTYEYNIDMMIARAELDVLTDELSYDDLFVAHQEVSMGVLNDLAKYKRQRDVYLKGRDALVELMEGDAIARLSPDEFKDKMVVYEAEQVRIELEDDVRHSLRLERRRRRSGP